MTEPDYTDPAVLTDLAGDWTIPLGGYATMQWDYDQVNEKMLRLYVQGKQRQWDADGLLEWEREPDPANPTGIPDQFISIAGSALWDRLPPDERDLARQHAAAWLYSQFLHSEQFALVGVGRVCAAASDLESKMFAATQLMDEARHVEAFNRYIKTTITVRYPYAPALRSLLEQVISESRWDFGVLAGHVMVENMALVTHAQHRERMGDPLARALSAYVARDEARHVAFGRLLLRQYYPQLTQQELQEREAFVLEGCWALKSRYVDDDVWTTLGFGEEAIAAARRSPMSREFRRRLFMRLVPGLKEVGLFGPRIQEGLAKMGVLGFADFDEESLRKLDEHGVDKLADADIARRREDIAATAALGAGQVADAPSAMTR
jgi:hypothetical protein